MTSSFVDVAIGLILMYLVLSLLCTTLNELIAAGLKWRAASLSQAIARMIDNPELRQAFYNSGLICNATAASRGGKVALSDAANASTAAAATPMSKQGKPPKDRKHPSYLEGGTFAMALLDSLTSTEKGKEITGIATGITKKFPSVDEIEKIVGDLPDSNIRDVLLASIASGKKHIADLRDDLATWFDSAMDRLSGDYKRWLKWLSLAIGIAVAVVFNADSIAVSRALWNDSTLRSNIVSAASQIVTKPPQAAEKACKETDPLKQTACLMALLKTDQERLRPFPVGWPDEVFAREYHNNPGLASLWVLLMKFLGLLWTGIALSLGAPFWFDLLQKFVNVRGTGPKPKGAEPKPKNP